MKTIFIKAIRHGLLLLLLAVALVPAVSRAQTSQYMSYQGYLTDGSGNALGGTNTGPKAYDVVFRIWDSPTVGNEIFSELQTVTVDNGYFSVLLGQGTAYSAEPTLHVPLTNVFTNSGAISRYVEVTVLGIGVNNFITILPRLQLVSSPFAFQAANALNITGTNVISAANLATNLGVWVVAGTNVYRAGGNVGIGTSTPGAALDVNGNIQLEGTHLIYDSANAVVDWGSGSLLFRSDTTLGNIGTYTTPMSLTAGGNLSVSGTVTAGSFSGSFSGVPSLSGANTYAAGSSQTYGNDFSAAGAFNYYGTLNVYSQFGPFVGGGVTLYDSPTYSTDNGGLYYSFYGDYSTDSAEHDIVLRNMNGKLLIQSGSGASAICVAANNNVGIHTTSPGYALDVNGSVNSSGVYYVGNGVNAYFGYGSDSFAATSGHPYAGITGPFINGPNGGWLGCNGNYSLLWEANGDVQMRAGLYQSSDRAVKEHFEEISPRDILDKISAMSITKWSYTNSPQDRHIGPVAQDFRAAFNLGKDDKSISILDESGVALAAIKEINQELQAKDAELKTLNAQVQELQATVQELLKARNNSGK